MSAFRIASFFHTVAALGVVFATANSAHAQGRGIGSDGGLRLLSTAQVQQELELVDDQIEKLEELESNQRDETREMFIGMRDRFRGLSREDRQGAMDEMREQMKTLSNGYVDEAKEILLPHQVTRWEQLKFQSEARRAGGADRFITSESIAEKLNITEEQMEAMKEKAGEIREAMQEKIAVIRAESQEELLSVLTPEQQEQYKALTGDTFAFEERQQQGGRARGDQGGRGGRRGDREGGQRGDRSGGRPNDRGSRPANDTDA